MLTHLFAIAPATVSWSPKVALVMILCNVVAIMVGKATIKHPNVGAALILQTESDAAAASGGVGIGYASLCELAERTGRASQLAALPPAVATVDTAEWELNLEGLSFYPTHPFLPYAAPHFFPISLTLYS